ncbi:MAG: ABC transporter ATP-binding protein [Planctomycetes bacterium]|nr:ABC transporter ATP-binding protein [Planctomycetota bacterium]
MIELQNISKSFNDQLVLDGLNLTIQDGETLVIIGRSGAGKSVILKHIVGLMHPDEGQVIVDGKDLAELTEVELTKIRLDYGMLFQGSALFDSLTVGENVGFALYEQEILSAGQVQERVKECLDLVGLQGVEELKPAELSGGMKKRVGLARALAIKPKGILYDEPTTGIDPVMADVINKLIIGLHDRLKVTAVAVTHDMSSAYKIADRIAMLHQGKIIGIGTPDEIRATTNPIVKNFILGIWENGDIE